MISSLLLVGAFTLCRGQTDEEALAKQAQNPIASLISVPFQNNTNLGIDPGDRIQNTHNIQPVVPFSTGRFNFINRSIIPLVYQPNLAQPGPTANEELGGQFGLGDINHTVFISPAKAGRITWGVGPSVTLRTATGRSLGTGKWSAGPSLVALAMPGKFVAGVLVSNLWSFAGDSERPDVSSMLLQYFVNYNLENGWYVVTAPVLTANWKADRGQRWVVPFGGGVGRIFKVGAQPVNAQVQVFGNAVRPDGASSWGVRLQWQFLFPKGG